MYTQTGVDAATNEKLHDISRKIKVKEQSNRVDPKPSLLSVDMYQILTLGGLIPHLHYCGVVKLPYVGYKYI